MRKLLTFVVMVATPTGFRETAKIEAHFMTGPSCGEVMFWTKPHWYSRRRCVAIVDWRYTVAIRNEASTNADWLKDAGVQI